MTGKCLSYVALFINSFLRLCDARPISFEVLHLKCHSLCLWLKELKPGGNRNRNMLFGPKAQRWDQ